MHRLLEHGNAAITPTNSRDQRVMEAAIQWAAMNTNGIKNNRDHITCRAGSPSSWPLSSSSRFFAVWFILVRARGGSFSFDRGSRSRLRRARSIGIDSCGKTWWDGNERMQGAIGHEQWDWEGNNMRTTHLAFALASPAGDLEYRWTSSVARPRILPDLKRLLELRAVIEMWVVRVGGRSNTAGRGILLGFENCWTSSIAGPRVLLDLDSERNQQQRLT
jgi:hypothetical protein